MKPQWDVSIPAVYRQRARDVTHRHLVGQLLQPQLLVFHKATASGLHRDLARGLVVRAALRRTLLNGHVLGTQNVLKDL